MGYIKQLDAVRAIAVILVIISHWYTNVTLTEHLAIGSIGVDVFFVLSGFLITKILLEHRTKAEVSYISSFDLVKNFYVRRALRIFPVYYLTIFALLIAGSKIGINIRSEFLYLLTYTYNIYLFKVQSSGTPAVCHLWSLAVEEQFYLIWPWLIVFINKKYLLAVITLFIFVGLISQYLVIGNEMAGSLPFTCFDCFGLGALFSYIAIVKPHLIARFYRWLSIAAKINCLFLLLYFLQIGAPLPIRTVHAIISLWIIAYIFQNTQNEKINLGIILNNPGLLFVGRISYGLYVYHLIIPYITNSKFFRLHINSYIPSFLKSYEYIIISFENILLLFLVAWISFKLIELRFLRLKKYFMHEPLKTTQVSYANIT